MPTTQPTLPVSNVSLSLVEGQRTLVVEHGVADYRVDTRDGRTPGLQLPASELVERFQPVLGVDRLE